MHLSALPVVLLALIGVLVPKVMGVNFDFSGDPSPEQLGFEKNFRNQGNQFDQTLSRVWKDRGASSSDPAQPAAA